LAGNFATAHESPDRRRCIFGKPADMTAAVPDWQEWYDAHAARLLLFARQWLPERADAEDAVQIGFVKFWRNRPRPAAADVPLLFAAVRSAALDLLRARTRRERRDTQAADDRTTWWWDADTVADEERAAAVQAALADLPIEQREVVTLRIWGGLTFADIARTLDANINTVMARFRSARAALALQISEACRDATD
jgi:RNA polymerase sigma-70 factor (ECF subfamily)